jgi:hypothetical protein
MRLALLVAGLAACSAGTEMVVVVSAGDVAIPAQVDKVRLLVANTPAGSPDLPLCAGAAADCLTLPLVATLIPGPDHPGDEVTVQVTAYLDGQPVIRDAASFVFRTGARERLDFVLHASCLGNLACADEMPAQSCGAGGRCAPLTVTPLGAHPSFDGGAEAGDLAGPAADFAAADLAVSDFAVSDFATVDLRPAADLTPLPGFAAASCVAANAIPSVGGFPPATCDAYCAHLNLVCADGCTTNRNFPNFGVEAWTDSAGCGGYQTSSGQAFCSDDLSSFSDPTVAKYRCCCH